MTTPPPHIEERTRKQQAVVPYLGVGFTKVAVPAELFGRIKDHFDTKKHTAYEEERNAYLKNENVTLSPSLLCHDDALNRSVSHELKTLHEQWCRFKLVEASCYGIRIYQAGSYLYNHVDLIATHVISATICVDRELTAPWPLRVEDVDGKPYEMQLEPGEMILYESALLKHGRPYPLQGNYYASLFVHYTPVGWTLTDQDVIDRQ